jgi:hypothetical protein
MLQSIVCRYADFSLPWYEAQARKQRIADVFANHPSEAFDYVDRKAWEFCAIGQALDERGFLAPGKRGLGFAVGREPLASYFAGRGCRILATDLAPEASEPGWIETGQHAASKDAIHYPVLVGREDFDRNVQFQHADMRTLEGLTPGHDFLWSSCALEHLGSLEAGVEFVVQSARLLAPGGLAVHTTEFNVRSDAATLETGGSVIYRRRDILALGERLASLGLRLAEPDFDVGDHRFDLDYDTFPYAQSGKPHLKLELGGHICTSMLLIIEKPA